MIISKKRSKCGVEKTLDNFTHRKDTGKYRSWCHECRRVEYKKNNKLNEAKEITYNLLTQTMCLNNGWECSADLAFFIDKKKGIVTCSNPWFGQKKIQAHCSENDEFNEHIGRMVTLCKMFNKPMPEWIKR